MFNVCTTAPIDGTARYTSMCSCEFHMNVPTRSPAVTPSLASAPAARPALSATVAYVARRGPSSVQVTHSASP